MAQQDAAHCVAMGALCYRPSELSAILSKVEPPGLFVNQETMLLGDSCHCLDKLDYYPNGKVRSHCCAVNMACVTVGGPSERAQWRTCSRFELMSINLQAGWLTLMQAYCDGCYRGLALVADCRSCRSGCTHSLPLYITLLIQSFFALHTALGVQHALPDV